MLVSETRHSNLINILAFVSQLIILIRNHVNVNLAKKLKYLFARIWVLQLTYSIIIWLANIKNV